ncbi:Calcium/calmodulin-dependent protein kinase type 1 [Phytophthora cinnamomi]|uniref:Calcium/calmodulin-dependent protein kinase type 1 n=1 Tax=Phytophthora cinnamomi TaxID=4785 RepID=UPI0035598D9D|nr:Calcium/calmodulin-dependent protein kinase type 1 [Phytophthora cinnamomi]
MSNEALASQERRYFALGLARVLLVFVVPSCIVFCTRDWFVDTIVFLVVTFVCLVELALALYRYYVLWPEGLQMRWVYWTEIVQAEDQYKLKILGYYIRKIDKFVGRFPSSLSANKIKREKAVMRTWAFYLLAIGSGLVVLRYAKLHLVELPQVLALRTHPEFATDGLLNAAESIPFARTVPSYTAAGSGHVVEVNVQKSAVEI